MFFCFGESGMSDVMKEGKCGCLGFGCGLNVLLGEIVCEVLVNVSGDIVILFGVWMLLVSLLLLYLD